MSSILRRVGWFSLCLVMAGCVGVSELHAEEQVWNLEEGLDELGRHLEGNLPSTLPPTTTVAIADFVDLQWRVTLLGRQVAEEMKSRLFGNHRRLTGLERAHLDRLINELCFNQTDLFDRALTKRFGRIIGADTILVGTIIDQYDSVRIIARLVKTDSGELVANASVVIAKDAQVKRLFEVKVEPPSQATAPCGPEKEVPHVEPQRPAPPSAPPPATPVFETSLVRVTVKSLTRLHGQLILQLWYENLTDHVIKLVSDHWGTAYATNHQGTYLLGDNGERWVYQGDFQVGNHYGGVELVPGLNLLNQITFVPERSNEATRFGYVGHYRVQWQEGPRGPHRRDYFQVVIKNLVAGAQVDGR